MDSELKKVVRGVLKIAEGLKIDIVLVGALMAELTPEIESDYPRFRRTNDADFGVYVRNWPTYQKLRNELLECKFTPDRSIEHRLHRGTAMVDLIPYGTQIAPDGKLAWPKSEFEMTVVGFDEVCAAACRVTVGDGLSVPVITVPGFVLLKIIAYLERKAQRNEKHKDDVRDIEYWLRNYASGTMDGRRYDLAKEFGLAHEDYETAGAVLLGIEVRALASAAAAQYLDRFLMKSDDPDLPFLDIMAASFLEETAEKKRKEGLALLAAFKKGYHHQR
ncbi:hypothetical protein ACFL6Y_11510 [Elusimicrobiota bacterium]